MGKEYLLIPTTLGLALSLIGSILMIIGVFLRWGRLSLVSGWDMITTTISGGNLLVFLILIFGIVAFFGGLVSVLAFIGNWASGVRKRIVYFLILEAFVACAFGIWYNGVYVSPVPLPFGFFVSWLGSILALIGAFIMGTGFKVFVMRKVSVKQ